MSRKIFFSGGQIILREDILGRGKWKINELEDP